MQWINALAKQIRRTARLYAIGCLTDIALLAGLGASSGLLICHLVSHVRAIVKLALLVLEVGVVRSVRPTSKVIVVSTAYYVVIWRSGCGYSQIVLITVRSTTCYTEALCSDLR